MKAIFELASQMDNLLYIDMSENEIDWYRNNPAFAQGDIMPTRLTILELEERIKAFIFRFSGAKYGQRRKINKQDTVRFVKGLLRHNLHCAKVLTAFNKTSTMPSNVYVATYAAYAIMNYNLSVQ